MDQPQRKRTGSQLVGHRDLAARLRAEFPQSRINVSPVRQGLTGECALSVSGVDASTVLERARVLACIAVLYNVAAFYNRDITKTRWTRFAALCDQNKHRTELRFRRGTETVSFYLEPVEQAVAQGDFTLHLREP
jgi:hypothetical protein